MKPCYVSQARTEAEISSGRVSDTKFGPQAGVVFSLPVYEPRNGEITKILEITRNYEKIHLRSIAFQES